MAIAACLLSGFALKAQLVQDGSFEGTRSNVPITEGWTDCSGSPDTQVLDGFGVGIFGIRTPAAHGEKYLGMLADDTGVSESIGQALPLSGGQLYTGHIDIFRSSVHNAWNGTGRIEIWAGDGCGLDQELLWTSGTIANEDVWQNYSVALLPRHSHNWISVKAVLDAGSGEMTYVCIDNFNLLSSALGFDFVDFSAQTRGSQIKLNWQTIALSDATDFDIAWSEDGQSFDEVIGSISGRTGESSFSYTLQAPQNGKQFFRISATDLDGNQGLSQVIETNIDQAAQIFVFPNPASSYINLTLPLNSNEICHLRMLDSQGRLVLEQEVVKTSSLRLELPAHLGSGLYFIESQIGNSIARKRLLLQR